MAAARKINGAMLVRAACTPDPVPAVGATYLTSAENIGYDRYAVRFTVSIVNGSAAGTSLTFRPDGINEVPVVQWYGGTLGPLHQTDRALNLERRRGTTATGHSIRTIVAFASDDPLDDDPSYPYTCTCTVDVDVA